MQKQLGFTKALVLFWTNYFNFKGRARRREYWFMQIWHIIFLILPPFILCGLGFIFAMVSKSGAATVASMVLLLVGLFYIFIYQIVTLIPKWALLIRRFHDTSRKRIMPIVFILLGIGSSVVSGILDANANQFLNITLIVTAGIYLLLGIYVLVVCCLDSKANTNKYGDSPKYINTN